MARKINVKLIMELRDAGLSRSMIASARHISRHSVSDVFNIADEKVISYGDISSLEEQEVYRLFYPEKFAGETMYGDPDYEYVHRELKKVGVTLRLLHEEYVDRCEQEGKIPMGKTKFNEGYSEFTIAKPSHKPSGAQTGRTRRSRLVRSYYALYRHQHGRSDHCIFVRRHTPLQPILIC